MKRNPVENFSTLRKNVVGTTVNRSQDIDYHTQRNNVYVPEEACNVTAYIMASKQAGHSLNTYGEQEEDYFYKFLQSKEALDYKKKNFPFTKAPTNEIHDVLRWGYNKLYGNRAIFSTNIHIRDIVGYLLRGDGIVLSGNFPLHNGKVLHHVVSLAGIVSIQNNIENIRENGSIDLEMIEDFIIDDPYGNWKSGYVNTKGNNIKISYVEFLRLMKNTNKPYKWAHIIRRK